MLLRAQASDFRTCCTLRFFGNPRRFLGHTETLSHRVGKFVVSERLAAFMVTNVDFVRRDLSDLDFSKPGESLDGFLR